MTKLQENEMLAEFLNWEFKDNYWFIKNDGTFRSYELRFEFDWNHLMLVVDKIRTYPVILNMEEDGSVALDEFKIGMNSMLLEYSKRINGKTVIGHSYRIFIDDDLNKSDCESYIEMVYKCCVDFVKFINE